MHLQGMETRIAAKLLTCLYLCASAAGLPVDGSDEDRFRNSAIHNLNTGLQVLQTISIAQLANLLRLPAQRWSELTSTGDRSLRLALEMTCTLHDHVNEFGRLKQELPNDVEVNAVHEVLKQNRKNSCHWVAALVPECPSMCTEERLSNICMRWKALDLSSAMDDLQQYIDEDTAVQHAWLSQHITNSVSEDVKQKLLQYLS